ncbi:MAG: hypothetical protein HQL68_11010, partial [Magnetococcales bacterium]|nr:hypothetical protein [Magnetococcales bacterium]
GEARGAFHDSLNDRTPELRRKYRKAVLSVTIADLQRVAKKYLAQQNASIAVVSSNSSLDKETDNDWARFTL